MKELNKIISQLKENFAFLLENNYTEKPVEINNEDDENEISARLTFVNLTAKKLVVFDVYPKSKIEIDIFITQTNTENSLDIKQYMEFKSGHSPQYSPSFIIDDFNSVDQLSRKIKQLITNGLKDVVFGKEWITIPTYDPRDQY